MSLGNIAWQRPNMATKTKLAKQREAANRIAEIMSACLSRLPKDEQERRVKAIEELKPSRNARGSTSKRVSTPQSLQLRSQGAAAA